MPTDDDTRKKDQEAPPPIEGAAPKPVDAPKDPEAAPKPEDVPKYPKTADNKDIVEHEAPKSQPYSPAEKRYDPEPARDEARKWLAFTLVWLLCGVVGASFLLLWILESASFANLKALIELVLAPVVALVGSATGFYFGGGGKTEKT
jgi:hypothetical protein